MVHPVGRLGEGAGQPLPFAVDEVVEIPGRQDHLAGWRGAAEALGDGLGHAQETVRAPRRAAAARAAALVVGPDPQVIQPDVGERLEFLVDPLQQQLGSAGLARAQLHMVMAAGFVVVAVVAGGPVRAQMDRAAGIGFVGQKGQAGADADALGGAQDRPQPLDHRLGRRVVDAGEVVHVEPDIDHVDAPQRQVFDVALDLLDGRLVIVVVEVRGEVHAAHRFLGRRRAAPGRWARTRRRGIATRAGTCPRRTTNRARRSRRCPHRREARPRCEIPRGRARAPGPVSRQQGEVRRRGRVERDAAALAEVALQHAGNGLDDRPIACGRFWQRQLDGLDRHGDDCSHHVHFHDGTTREGRLDLVPIGQGEIDHRRAVQLLGSSGYDGYLSGEWIGWEPFETHLPRELKTMRSYE